MLSAVLASGRTYQVTLGDFGDETTMGPRLSWRWSILLTLEKLMYQRGAGSGLRSRRLVAEQGYVRFCARDFATNRDCGR